MSSRQAEKERRREERLAREQAEKRSAARRKRLQYALGALIAAAGLAGLVVFVVVGIGSGNGGDGGEPRAPSDTNVQLPPQAIGNLQAAADAAGCKLANPEIEGAEHLDKEFAPSDYKTNPPTSGNHFGQWYEDGIYDPGGLPNLGMIVHTLEHGRINIQYKPGTPAEAVAQLEALLAETDGYHMLLYENTTGMDAQVAATTWGHSLTCPEMNDKVFDAMRTFRTRWIDKGPENVP